MGPYSEERQEHLKSRIYRGVCVCVCSQTGRSVCKDSRSWYQHQEFSLEVSHLCPHHSFWVRTERWKVNFRPKSISQSVILVGSLRMEEWGGKRLQNLLLLVSSLITGSPWTNTEDYLLSLLTAVSLPARLPSHFLRRSSRYK